MRNGVLQNNNMNPAAGDKTYVGIQPLCPANQLSLYVSVGNQGTNQEVAELRVYAEENPTTYFGGTTLGLFEATIPAHGTLQAPVMVTIPTAIPRNRAMSILVQIDSANQVSERREYDNYARSALQIRIGSPAACGA